MTKTRIMVVVCFLVALAAGTALGMLVGRKPPETHHTRPSLATRLDLTPEQQESFRKIWEPLRSPQHRQREREQRDALQKARDEAIKSALTLNQALWYDDVMNEYSRAAADLRARPFHEAVRLTNEILNDEQRAKYESILKEQSERGISRPGGGPSGAAKRSETKSGAAKKATELLGVPRGGT
jgi:Spy/CpxP family protein refolding chaperone